MRIVDAKGKTVETYDAEAFHLVEDEIVHHHPAVAPIEEVWHREMIWQDADSPENQLFERVVDSPAIPGTAAWDEVEKVQRLVAFTEEELQANAERKAAEERERIAAAEEAELAAQRQARIEALPADIEVLFDAVAELGITMEELRA